MGKKIYLISYYFAPLGRADGVNRTLLTKGLADQGWKIDVVSCANYKGTFLNFQEDTSLLRLLGEQVALYRIENPQQSPFRELAAAVGMIPDAFEGWIKPAISACKKIVQDFGVIYAVIPPVTNAIVASYISQHNQMPLVIDFRDNVFNLNRDIVQKAQAIIASTPQSLTEMIQFYQIGDQIKSLVAYNGFLENSTDVIGSQQKQKKNNQKIKIIYTGLLNYAQDPAILARCIKQLSKTRPDIMQKLGIDYYGPENYYTKIFLKPYLSQVIKFKGYVIFSEALLAMSQADFGYTSLRYNSKSYCIPSKVFQYLSQGLPLIATGPDGALKELINTYKIGVFSEFSNLERHKENILNIIEKPHCVEELRMNVQKFSHIFQLKEQIMKISELLKSLGN